MCHAAAAPGFIVILGGLVLPDSPVSLIERGHLEKARKVLSRVRGVEDVDEEFQDIVEAARVANMVKRPWRNIIRSQYRYAGGLLPGSSYLPAWLHAVYLPPRSCPLDLPLSAAVESQALRLYWRQLSPLAFQCRACD